MGEENTAQSKTCYLFIICQLCGLISIVLWLVLLCMVVDTLPYLWIYPVVINVVTLVLDIVDKCISVDGKNCYWRIPELALWICILAGGTPLGATKFWLVNHKKSKTRYQVAFFIVAMVFICVLSAVEIYLGTQGRGLNCFS